MKLIKNKSDMIYKKPEIEVVQIASREMLCGSDVYVGCAVVWFEWGDTYEMLMD